MFSSIIILALVILALWLRSVRADQRDLARRIDLLKLEIERLGGGDVTHPGEVKQAGPGPAGEIKPEDGGSVVKESTEPETENKAGSEPQEAAPPPKAAVVVRESVQDRVDNRPNPFTPKSESGSRGVDLESLIGGRWSALLGGLAVALGVLFLARYSIEAGLLGPRARLAMGTVFSVALFAAGEVLRRRDSRDRLPPLMSADIPGILTGAGAIGAFGTLYAAYALYGFIGPAIAFVGLTALGIASLLLSAVHGPKLAALGLVGAYAAPLLVSSQSPNPVAFALHILVVTASVMGVARIRNWTWLAIGGIVGSSLLAPLLLTIDTGQGRLSLALLLLALFVVHVASLIHGVAERPAPPEDRPVFALGTSAMLALVLVAGVAVATWESSLLQLLLMSALAALIVIASGGWPSMAASAPLSAALIVVTLTALQIDFPALAGMTTGLDLQAGRVAPDIGGYVRDSLLMALPSALLAIMFGFRAAATAPRMAGWLALAVMIIAVLCMVEVYLAVAPFETDVPTGLAALALAGLMLGLTEAFVRARPDDWTAPAPAWLAVAAVALSGLAIAILLTRQWMPVGFAVTAAGACQIYRKRPVPALGWLAVGLALLAGSGLYFNAPFAADEIGTTPFINMLLLIVGLPAALLVWGGLSLRKAGAKLPGELVIASGLALSGLFVGLELRHFITGGDILGARFGLIDMATQSMAALGFAIGLQFAARRSEAVVFDLATLVAGALSLAAMTAGLLFVYNPYIDQAPVGEGRVFNLLLPGYLITGLLAILTGYLAPVERPSWYRLSFGVVGAALLFFYVSLMVRHGFQGADVGYDRFTPDAEIWTYSVAWLAMGACALALGLTFRSMPLRAASAVIILLTVAKVFLVDMSALTGVLRAFSFIGLGVSLIIIGRLYQRVLLRNRDPEQQAG